MCVRRFITAYLFMEVSREWSAISVQRKGICWGCAGCHTEVVSSLHACCTSLAWATPWIILTAASLQHCPSECHSPNSKYYFAESSSVTDLCKGFCSFFFFILHFWCPYQLTFKFKWGILFPKQSKDSGRMHRSRDQIELLLIVFTSFLMQRLLL